MRHLLVKSETIQTYYYWLHMYHYSNILATILLKCLLLLLAAVGLTLPAKLDFLIILTPIIAACSYILQWNCLVAFKFVYLHSMFLVWFSFLICTLICHKNKSSADMRKWIRIVTKRCIEKWTVIIQHFSVDLSLKLKNGVLCVLDENVQELAVELVQLGFISEVRTFPQDVMLSPVQKFGLHNLHYEVTWSKVTVKAFVYNKRFLFQINAVLNFLFIKES